MMSDRAGAGEADPPTLATGPAGPAAREEDKLARRPNNVGTNFTELKDLLVGYAKQETSDPLRGLAKFVGLGLAGSVLVGIGGLLLMLGVLRVLQTETGEALDGRLSFAPYLITLVALVLVIAVIGLGISRSHRRNTASRTRSAR
jgi:hypothetical protein